MRIVTLIAGIILLVIGLLSIPTPFPVGTLFITVAAGMIICSSDTAAKYIQTCRAKFTRFDRIALWLENKTGERLSEPLRRTRPELRDYDE